MASDRESTDAQIRERELIEEMAQVIAARWEEEGTTLRAGLIECLTAEEEMKQRAWYTGHATLCAMRLPRSRRTPSRGTALSLTWDTFAPSR